MTQWTQCSSNNGTILISLSPEGGKWSQIWAIIGLIPNTLIIFIERRSCGKNLPKSLMFYVITITVKLFVCVIRIYVDSVKRKRFRQSVKRQWRQLWKWWRCWKLMPSQIPRMKGIDGAVRHDPSKWTDELNKFN